MDAIKSVRELEAIGDRMIARINDGLPPAMSDLEMMLELIDRVLIAGGHPPPEVAAVIEKLRGMSRLKDS